MYFWNTTKLKNRLREKSLTDGEVFPYFILFILTMSIPVSSCWEYYDVSDYILEARYFFIPIFGSMYAYVKNNGKGGSQFLQRYFSLSWVLLLRFTFLLTLIFALLFFIDNFAVEILNTKTQWFVSSIFFAFQLAYYFRLGFHMKDLAN